MLQDDVPQSFDSCPSGRLKVVCFRYGPSGAEVLESPVAATAWLVRQLCLCLADTAIWNRCETPIPIEIWNGPL